MKLLKELSLLNEAEFDFMDERAEEEWYDHDPTKEIQGEYPNFPGLEVLGDVTMLTGYRSDSVGSVLYKDKDDNVYEVDTLSGDGSEHYARESGHKVKDLGEYFL